MSTSDLLGYYGPDAKTRTTANATCGGVKEAKPLPYSPPTGPKGQMRQAPGLGGTNHGNCGTQGKR